jgi:hypothetical protein
VLITIINTLEVIVTDAVGKASVCGNGEGVGEVDCHSGISMFTLLMSKGVVRG